MRVHSVFFKVSVLLVLVGLFLGVFILYNKAYRKPVVPVTVSLPATLKESSSTTVEEEVIRTAIMGNGCFWCAEADFEKVPGVRSVVSGYAGGAGDTPTYKDYAEGGFREVVEITYDSSRVSFGALVEYLIKHGDPTDGEGSFYDRGREYAPAIYFDNDEEKRSALLVIASVDEKRIFDKPIALAVLPRVRFWPAEEYHQDYYKKNPIRYEYYRQRSGRDAFIKKHWGEHTGSGVRPVVAPAAVAMTPWKNYVKPSKEVLRKMLIPLQYHVTQEEGTEAPFKNEYDTNKAEGIYVDVLSGEPLYSSLDKYDSGTGWPSFVKPITEGSVVLREDRKLFSVRTEVRSLYGDAHLGHVFNDGPKDRGGLRYCMNSAALRFVPKESLAEMGYGDYLALFK